MSYKNFYKKPEEPVRKKRPAKPARQRIGDYQLFVGAFPTGELADWLQQIRQEIDGETAAVTAPHVTLAGTYWRNGKPTRAGAHGLIERLDMLASKLTPFDLEMGGIYTFGKRVIYLGVSPTEPLLKVRRYLLNAVGEDKHRRFRPHLTLAMQLADAAFEAALAELKAGDLENGRFSSPITEISLMQRAEGEAVWRTIHTIHLG